MMPICAAYSIQPGVANASARFTNFLSDRVTTKSAWDECVRRDGLDWRNEQGVTSEEASGETKQTLLQLLCHLQINFMSYQR